MLCKRSTCSLANTRRTQSSMLAGENQQRQFCFPLRSVLDVFSAAMHCWFGVKWIVCVQKTTLTAEVCLDSLLIMSEHPVCPEMASKGNRCSKGIYAPAKH